MQQRTSVPPDSLADADSNAATPAALLRLMRELVELTGQQRADGLAVLELQFEEILTVTSLSTQQPAPFLSVALYLPRRPHTAAPALSAPPYAGGELLWDASEGRYVILERCAVETLGDERGVFDAILDAKDRAAAWLAELDAAAIGRGAAAAS
jgi:hypothetical protein